jgi:hypothetical protein
MPGAWSHARDAERTMALPRRTILLVILGLSAAGSLGVGAIQTGGRKPQVFLAATPTVAFPPAKIRFTADLRGGDDDFEEFYCASVEWEWDDGTTSESAADCEPYEAGRSRIVRHFTAEHKYDAPDNYHPAFRLKKRGKVVAQAKADVEVRPGLQP